VLCTCHPSKAGHLSRRIGIRAAQGKKRDPIFKITREREREEVEKEEEGLSHRILSV
jgi:hypothetical protein